MTLQFYTTVNGQTTQVNFFVHKLQPNVWQFTLTHEQTVCTRPPFHSEGLGMRLAVTHFMYAQLQKKRNVQQESTQGNKCKGRPKHSSKLWPSKKKTTRKTVCSGKENQPHVPCEESEVNSHELAPKCKRRRIPKTYQLQTC